MRLLCPEAAHGYILGFFYEVRRRALYGHRVCLSVSPWVTYFSAEICPSVT